MRSLLFLEAFIQIMRPRPLKWQGPATTTTTAWRPKRKSEAIDSDVIRIFNNCYRFVGSTESPTLNPKTLNPKSHFHPRRAPSWPLPEAFSVCLSPTAASDPRNLVATQPHLRNSRACNVYMYTRCAFVCFGRYIQYIHTCMHRYIDT